MNIPAFICTEPRGYLSISAIATVKFRTDDIRQPTLDQFGEAEMKVISSRAAATITTLDGKTLQLFGAEAERLSKLIDENR